MARNNHEFDKAQEYLRRHSFIKRWMSVMLVLALLITTATLYAMNKAASAVTEEGAEEIGMVLSSAADDENVEESQNEETESYSDSEESLDASVLAEASDSYAEENTEFYSEENEAVNTEESAETFSEETTESFTEENAETYTEDSTDASAENKDSTIDNNEVNSEGNSESIVENNTSEGTTEESSENNSHGNSEVSDEVLTSEENNAEEVAASSEEVEASEDEDEKNADDSEKKAAKIDVPDSVDVAEYVTKTIIERELPDGNWEEITENDIEPGDRLRITLKYVLPKEATVSDNIHYELPTQYGTAETNTAQVENADANYQVSEDNQIKIQYSEEHKKETLNSAIAEINEEQNTEQTDSLTEEQSENLTVEQNNSFSEQQTEEQINEQTDSFFEEQTQEQSNEQTSEQTEEYIDAEASDDLFSMLNGGAVLNFFRDSFVITAHAASNENESEVVVYSSVKGMKIRNVSIKKNPEQQWNNGVLGYSGGTEISSGSMVTEGDTILFTLEYLLGIGTIDENNRTFKYNLAEKEITVTENVSDYIYNSDNEKVGVFSIDKDTGEATFDFYEKFAKNNKDQIIYGNFYFSAKAELANGETEKTLTYNFGKDLVYTVIIKKAEKYDLSVNKKGSYNTNTGEVSYTIVVSTKYGTDGNILFNDVFKVFNNKWGDNNENTDLETAIDVNSQLSAVNVIDSNGAAVTVSPSCQGNNISMELPKLDAGKSYTITYTFKVPEAISKHVTATVLKNQASAKDNRNKASGTKSFYFSGDAPKINKWASQVDSDNRTVTWTIELNSEKKNLKGFTLTDHIWKGYNKKLTPDVPVKVSPKLDGKDTISLANGYKFEKDDYTTYTFTYTYSYDETYLVYDAKLVNDASIRLNPDDATTGNDVTGYGAAKDINFVSKKHGDITYDSDGWVNIDWNVTLLAPITNNAGKDQAEYWVYYDEITDGTQLITDQQLEALKSNLQSTLSQKGYTGTFKLEKGDARSNNGKSGYRTFKIKFYGNLNSNIEFSYKTSGYVAIENEDVRLYNQATVHNKTSGDSVPFDKIRLVKMDGKYQEGTSGYDYYSDDLFGEGILTWIIKVTIPKNSSYSKMVLTDTLPDNVTLLNTEGEQHGGKTLYGLEVSMNRDFPEKQTIALNSKAAEYSNIYRVDGKNISIDLDINTISKEISDSKADIYLRVRAKVDDSFDFENLKKGSFTNTVYLGNTENSRILEATQTQEVTKTETVIKKTSNMNLDDAANTIEYTVDINPNAADLLPNGDTLTMTDTFVSKAEKQVTVALLQNYIKVYEVTAGSDGSEASRELGSNEYTYEVSSYSAETSDWNKYMNSGLINFKIPDSKHLKIVYRYTFNGDKGAQIEISNDAKLTGTSFDGNSSEDKLAFTIQRVGAAANTRGIEVYKVDKDNNGLKLAGAKFKLYIWTDNNTKWREINSLDGSAVNLTTGSDGKISLTPLVFNTAYKLEEEEAPQGYLKSDEPLVFYVSAADKKTYPMNLPADFADQFGVVYTPGQKVNFANVSEHTEIKISKYWKNEDAATKPSTIAFNLKRMYVVEDGGKGVSTTFRSVHVDSRNANNYIIGYTGFPFVKNGSILTLTIYGYRDQWKNTIMPSVTINGKEVDKNELAKLFDTSGGQEVKYSIPVTQDLKVVVKVPNYEDEDKTNPTIETPSAKRGSASSYVEDEEFSREIRLYEESGWTTTLDDLEKYKVEDNKKYEYLYYISEVSTMFYTISEKESQMGPINSGELWITNERNDVEAYALPETGGTGRFVYTIGGIALMVMALVFEEWLRRKRKKNS